MHAFQTVPSQVPTATSILKRPSHPGKWLIGCHPTVSITRQTIYYRPNHCRILYIPLLSTYVASQDQALLIPIPTIKQLHPDQFPGFIPTLLQWWYPQTRIFLKIPSTCNTIRNQSRKFRPASYHRNMGGLFLPLWVPSCVSLRPCRLLDRLLIFCPQTP